MRELLKTDFKRIFKDTLFLVLMILAVVFAIISPVLSHTVVSFMQMDEFAENFIFAKTTYFDAFSTSSSMGLITPILLTVAICKDNSHGTIRNKIICGHSRTKVYLSRFITLCVYSVGIMLFYALLSLGVSLMFFNYQPEPFKWVDFWFLLLSTGLDMLVYILVASMIAFFTVSMKNAGLAIVLYIAALFVFIIVGTVTNLAVGLSFDEPSAVLVFIDNANVFSSSIIGVGESYTVGEFLSLLIPNSLLAGGFFWLGLIIFKKKDLK